MNANDLSEKIMYNVNRALATGVSQAEVITILECIKIAMAQTIIRTNDRPIVPVTVPLPGR
jgi:hypothetical protein